MITFEQVRAARLAFFTTQYPPMSQPWNALKIAAVEAVKQYARENNMTIDAVVAQIERLK
jgi:hypothetical protein